MLASQLLPAGARRPKQGVHCNCTQLRPMSLANELPKVISLAALQDADVLVNDALCVFSCRFPAATHAVSWAEPASATSPLALRATRRRPPGGRKWKKIRSLAIASAIATRTGKEDCWDAAPRVLEASTL